MNQIANELINKSRNWLRHDVLPLWSTAGFDFDKNCYVESLSTTGMPLATPRRALVQARQIYSFLTAAKMDLFEKNQAETLAKNSLDYLLKNYLQPSGAFVHAVDTQEKISNPDQDLYTQAFVLFALGGGYQATQDSNYKTHALQLLQFLKSNRAAPGGGFTEIKNGQTFYQSNPHMHLFEAALLWLQVDPTGPWKTLCDEIFSLCQKSFVDLKTKTLAEHFDINWTKQIANTEHQSFIFEPGHHYEWAWLLAGYQDLTAVDCKDLRHMLFATAEKHGVNQKGFAVDEVLSDFTVKKRSSRFWPQCERIKAAVKLGLESAPDQQPQFAKTADEALNSLFTYLNLPIKGLWQDMILEDGNFSQQDPKASSLYHIINAMDEYIKIRPQLLDK